MVERMSVTQALVELKLLDARIMKKISESANFAEAINPKTDARKSEDIAKQIGSSYQSVTDLIDRRDAIKRAVVLSNATKKIQLNIAGEMRTFTIAEAIDMKNSGIGYRRALITKMIADGNRALKNYNGMSMEIQKQALGIAAAATQTPRITPEDASNVSVYKEFLENNKIEMIDPLKIAEKAEAMDKEITDFLSLIDTTLSIANATTEIEIRYGKGCEDEEITDTTAAAAIL